jgi:hypothetical protein
MRKSLLFAASLAIAFGSLAPGISFAKGNPNSCGPEVSVSVSFDKTAGYKITQGTGDPPYLAGFQVGNCSYDFTLNLFNSSPQITVLLPDRPPTTAWFFNFDRIGSVPVMDGGLLQATWCNAVDVRNADGSFPYSGTQVLDNYQPCGDDGIVDPIKGRYFAKRNVGFGLVDDYGLRFQVSPWEGQVGGDAAGTDYIKVYHPTANTWILEPEFDATSVLRDGSRKRAGAPILQSMPFKAVVTRLAP